MLKLNKLKPLSSRGFSHVEFILIIIVVAAISAIGTYVFKHQGASHASNDIFTSLGESVQSPTAASAITQATITADTATMTADANVLNTHEYPLVQTYQNAVNTATAALATVRKIYDVSPAPRDSTGVNEAQTNLNRAETILHNELANEQALVAKYESAKSQLANDQQSFNATTAGFANSVFYSYICRSPGSSPGSVDLTIGMVASSYESAMQSGAYSPTAAILLNGNNSIALSRDWNYVGTLQLTTTQNAPSGAWLVTSKNNIPQTDEVAVGPYPNGTYAAAWSSAVNIASISNCNPATTSSPQYGRPPTAQTTTSFPQYGVPPTAGATTSSPQYGRPPTPGSNPPSPALQVLKNSQSKIILLAPTSMQLTDIQKNSATVAAVTHVFKYSVITNFKFLFGNLFGHKFVTEKTIAIPFHVTQVPDSSLNNITSSVITTKGVNGSEILKSSNGHVLSTTIVTAPVTQVEKVDITGWKTLPMEPNGTITGIGVDKYTNSFSVAACYYVWTRANPSSDSGFNVKLTAKNLSGKNYGQVNLNGFYQETGSSVIVKAGYTSNWSHNTTSNDNMSVQTTSDTRIPPTTAILNKYNIHAQIEIAPATSGSTVWDNTQSVKVASLPICPPKTNSN